MSCKGILGTGGSCTARPKKNDTYCGTHCISKFASEDDRKEKFKANLIKKYKFILSIADIRNILRRIPNYELERKTFEEIDELIKTNEQILREQVYVGFNGEFLPSTLKNAQQFIVKTAYEMAFERLKTLPGYNLTIVHALTDWTNYLLQLLYNTGFFDAIIVRGEHNINCNKLHDPVIYNTIIKPIIIAEWLNISARDRTQILTCFQTFAMLHIEHLEVTIHEVQRVNPAEVQEGLLFVNDRQNVHRTDTVQHVKKIFDILMKIPIDVSQNTLASIIQHCNLSGKAIIQLTTMYCDPTPIYEIENAYPQALDAVWAYITYHPEKKELYQRVKDELTDNIGMCAQGNLSRICNIVSGYLDGVEPMVSKVEEFQNKIAALAADQINKNKIETAKQLLKEYDVPTNEWNVWLEALEQY